jgi:AcrR family transcriptional regulator
MSIHMKSTTRPYRMSARAESAEATRARIVAALNELFRERFLDDISLADVAERAGVSVQTVLRRFGSRDGLFEAGASAGRERIRDERFSTPVGDLDAAVRNLVDHYESDGELALHMLAQEGRSATIDPIVVSGRRLHREWVERTFAPLIARRPGAAAQLVAICDVYFWKVLRRDLGLGREATERSIRDLVRSLDKGA